MTNQPKNNGPDPALLEAIQTLNKKELSPLEEVMFKSWADANQIEDPDSPDNRFDFRSLYTQTGGKVFPPGQLRAMTDKASAIDTLMKAQQSHEEASPIQQMMGSEKPLTF